MVELANAAGSHVEWRGSLYEDAFERFRFIAGEVGFVPNTAEELLAESHRQLLLIRPSDARFDQSASRGTSMRPVAPVLAKRRLSRRSTRRADWLLLKPYSRSSLQPGKTVSA